MVTQVLQIKRTKRRPKNNCNYWKRILLLGLRKPKREHRKIIDYILDLCSQNLGVERKGPMLLVFR